MGARWAAADVTVDPRLEGGDAGGRQRAAVALAAGELHRTVMPTPGLRAPAGVARHGVVTGPAVEAGLRQAFVHVFLTRRAFGRDQVKAQHARPETAVSTHSLHVSWDQGLSTCQQNQFPIHKGFLMVPRGSRRLESEIPPSLPCLVSLHALRIQFPKYSPIAFSPPPPAPLLPRQLFGPQSSILQFA